MAFPLPVGESARLEALRRYRILDTAPEQAYDDIVMLASRICDAPIALVSLLDADRQWFKARLGFDQQETPRELAFCAHAILSPETMIVPDATKDPRFDSHPLVCGEEAIRFYAGAPLIDSGGNALGTLCVIDKAPRQLSPDQESGLAALRRIVVREIEQRTVAQALATALENVKTLGNLIPICSYCKSIRNDEGYWEAVEEFLHEHAETGLTHGICPTCLKQHFPDLFNRMAGRSE